MGITITNRLGEKMKLSNNADLQTALEELTAKKQQQEEDMQNYFDGIKDDLKPKNLVRAAASKITGSSDTKGMALKIGGTIAAAFITKKIISGTQKKVKKHEAKHKSPSMLGAMVKTTLMDIVFSHTDEVKTVLLAAVKNLFINKDTRIVKVKTSKGVKTKAVKVEPKEYTEHS